ncbi:hypothetical protein F511_24103 [Dorcoceras hygrometricum]|uniref:Aminotransferase-like plant mobile domain-containing protein n=1 Tax=Dorcoceras hygrometricum TaxID=472368 RepID=A0A2Z7ADS3_9LAMI|nr:hypothetical protein F511_24103 [Dorcoceras hygrometricum]
MGKKTVKHCIMTTEAEAVDDVHAKIGKQFYSRCSPTYFSNVMSELKPILGEQQRMRISDSPFCKWIDMPVLAISSGRLDYFLNRFDVPSCSFLINDDVMIPFRSSDFSIVLGLHHSGQPVDLDLKMESRFLARHFASKVTKADRAAIRERMMLLAGTSYVTPGFIFPYLDDLTTFFNHAWGDAAFRFLYREICHLGSKMYVDGCVVGLMALVYESIPTLGFRRSLNLYPRLFRWGKSRIPLKSDEADTLLNRVDKTQVLPIRPFNEEENLVDLKRVERSEDGMSEVRRLEKILIRQSENINLLEKRCGELEDQNIRHELNVAEAVLEKGGKSVLSWMKRAFVDVDEASNSLGEEELDEFRGRADFIGHEKSSDEDRKLVIEFLGKEKLEEEGIFKLWNSKHDAFAVGTTKVYIRFLAGFLRHLSRFEIASQDLVRERCRQQGPTLNCGVYSCMWLHCLAYDTLEIWKCQQKVDVNAYRVRIAGTILGSITNVF